MPAPAIVSTYGDTASGNLAPGSIAPTVQYRVAAAFDGVATGFALTGILLDSSKVSQVNAPMEQSDSSYIGVYRPVRGGTHPITFSVVSRSDASYTQTCSTSLQLNLSAPPNLSTSIDASPMVVANGGGSIVTMASANASDCDIYRDLTRLVRTHPLLANSFSTGPLNNLGTTPITTRYRSSCTNGVQPAAEDFVDIVINPSPTATLSIMSGTGPVDSTTIAQNTGVTLSWQSSYATFGCSIRDQFGTAVGSDPLPTASGTITVNNLPASRTFTLTCRDGVMATATDSVQVNVSVPGLNFEISSNGSIARIADNYQLGNNATTYTVNLVPVGVVAGSCTVTESTVNITAQIPKTVSTGGMAASVSYSASCIALVGGAVNAVATVIRPAIPAPRITMIGIDVDDEDVDFRWSTDQPCRITLEWAKSEAGLSAKQTYTTYTTSGSHGVELDDDERYYFRIRAVNEQGMETLSSIQTFETD